MKKSAYKYQYLKYVTLKYKSKCVVASWFKHIILTLIKNSIIK